jgi:demethylmenaquinone methyltransferase/2-methoxy-6-polyprenyl-1,4-benzoquinol methylase
MVPFLGRFFSKDDRAYTYLPESVMTFPAGDDFLETLKSAGFKNPTKKKLTFGIATIYTGQKMPT